MKISFDFDGTLDDEFGGQIINHQKEEIQQLAKKYVEEGHDVCIVTRRYDESRKKLGLKNEHVVVYELAKKLGITDINFTNREFKFSHLIRLKVDMHFENSEEEIHYCNVVFSQNDYLCKIVPVERKGWRDLLN
jgi:hypothetical protein